MEVAFLVQKLQTVYYVKEFNRLSPEKGKFKPVIPSIEMTPPHPIDGKDSTSAGGPIDRLIAAVAGQRGGVPAASVNEILTIRVSSQRGELVIFLGLQNDPSNITVNCTVYKILQEKAKQVIPRRPDGSEIVFRLTKKDETIIVLRKDAAKAITMAECFTTACRLEKGDVIEIEMAVVDIEEQIEREVYELSD